MQICIKYLLFFSHVLIVLKVHSEKILTVKIINETEAIGEKNNKLFLKTDKAKNGNSARSQIK